MTARVIRARDLVRVPWKNGGGTTAELAAFPEGANFDNFEWRISMADVASDGPFSPFPGIDRTLVVLEGSGIELDVAGTLHRLNPLSPSLSFSGDEITVGRLLSGPIRDLNVMTRRGRFAHAVRIVQAGAVPLSGSIRTGFLVAMDGAINVMLREETYSLDTLDTLAIDARQEPLLLSGSGRAILVEIAPVSSA